MQVNWRVSDGGVFGKGYMRMAVMGWAISGP